MKRYCPKGWRILRGNEILRKGDEFYTPLCFYDDFYKRGSPYGGFNTIFLSVGKPASCKSFYCIRRIKKARANVKS